MSHKKTATTAAARDERMEPAPDAGSPPTFDDVYAQYFDFVWRTCRRLGVGPGAIDDVCQEVFVVVHRRLAEFEGRSTTRTWIFGILLNVIRAHRRGIRRKSPTHASRESLIDPDDLHDPGGSPHRYAERAETAALAASFLERLDEDKRIVLVLAEIEEMTVTEISKCLDININTVYARLRVARQQFRQMALRHAAREAWKL